MGRVCSGGLCAVLDALLPVVVTGPGAGALHAFLGLGATLKRWPHQVLAQTEMRLGLEGNPAGAACVTYRQNGLTPAPGWRVWWGAAASGAPCLRAACVNWLVC